MTRLLDYPLIMQIVRLRNVRVFFADCTVFSRPIKNVGNHFTAINTTRERRQRIGVERFITIPLHPNGRKPYQSTKTATYRSAVRTSPGFPVRCPLNFPLYFYFVRPLSRQAETYFAGRPAVINAVRSIDESGRSNFATNSPHGTR